MIFLQKKDDPIFQSNPLRLLGLEVMQPRNGNFLPGFFLLLRRRIIENMALTGLKG